MLQVKALGVGRLLVDKNGFLYKSWYNGGTPKLPNHSSNESFWSWVNSCLFS